MAGRLYAGTSGFSYRSWRGGFYPSDARADEFLRLYAERLPSVELVGVFYRVPPKETFARWATQTPPDFRFTVKMNRRIALFGDLSVAPTFADSVGALGSKLGPLRIQLVRPRDDEFLDRLLESFPPPLQLALDLPHASWTSPEVDTVLAEVGAVRVNALDGDAPFRYLRLREPPYDDEALSALAASIRPLLATGVDIYCFFKHEDEPRGVLYAERLLHLADGQV